MPDRHAQYFRDYTNHLVHDPSSSLVIGDLISMHRLRVSSAVHHVVAAIVAPFGTPIAARPPIPTPDDRLAAYKAKRFRKLERRELRQRATAGDAEAVQTLKERGLAIEGGGDGHAAGGAVKKEGQAKAEQSRVNRKERKVAEKLEVKARAARKAEKAERREGRQRESEKEAEANPVVVGETVTTVST